MTSRSRRRTFDIWPGFVDALTSLVMVMIFVLLIFAIGQFVLTDAISGKNRALDALNVKVAALAKTLSLSEDQKRQLDAKARELSASLSTSANERGRLQTELDASTQAAATLTADIAALSTLKQQLESDIASRTTELDASKQDLVKQTTLTSAATAQVELLNRQVAALNEQLAKIQAALDIKDSDAKAKDEEIADLGKQLNIALAKRVGELERYRSEFFGKLRKALGDRSDVRVVGDRFVVPTDLLFVSGSADINPDATARLEVLANTVQEIAAEIPSSIDWVLRIDGHTDKRPIHTDRFPSNWELSTARAVSVVKYLVVSGIPANRLSANGFGAFQPIDKSDTPEAYAKNRRIEIQLTNR